jgi:hypothetical protein
MGNGILILATPLKFHTHSDETWLIT